MALGTWTGAFLSVASYLDTKALFKTCGWGPLIERGSLEGRLRLEPLLVGWAEAAMAHMAFGYPGRLATRLWVDGPTLPRVSSTLSGPLIDADVPRSPQCLDP